MDLELAHRELGIILPIPRGLPSTNHASCVNWREKEGKHLAGLECGAGGEERVSIYLLCHDKESSLY